MSENSRTKKLPIAVLVAPALAFGSLTFATVPALADTIQSPSTSPSDTPTGQPEEPNVAGNADPTPPVNDPTTDGDTPGREDKPSPEGGEDDEADQANGADPVTINRVEEGEGGEAERVELLNTADPTITVDSVLNEIVPGDILEVEGSGFTPESTIVLSIDSNNLDTVDDDEIVVSEEGTFVASVFLPDDIEPGTYNVTATDSANEEATFQITVLDWADLLALNFQPM